MIIYGTKQTNERFKLQLPQSEQEQEVYNALRGDAIHEWGARLFYLSGRKCLQVVNFASKFTLYLFDLKISDMDHLDGIITHYLADIYEDDPPMLLALRQYLIETRTLCFGKLTNKSIISTLNRNHLVFADEGYYFFNFIENNILNTHAINREMNRKYILTIKRPNQKEPDYIFPAEEFRRLIMERYGQKPQVPKPNIPVTI